MIGGMHSVRILPTEFISEDETIRGAFVLPHGDGPFPGICKFHGFPGGPNQTGGIATKLAQAGFAVLTFDFRGFRQSDGVFSLAGEILDAHASISHLLESGFVFDSWVGLYGASFGAAIAVCTAAQDPRVQVVALRAPVYDTIQIARSSLIKTIIQQTLESDPSQIHQMEEPAIREAILQRMLEDAKRFNPMHEVSKISPRPLLIIHGSDDEEIDLAGVKRLYELAGEPKQLVIVDGADHVLSNPVAHRITLDAIVHWFRKTWDEVSHNR